MKMFLVVVGVLASFVATSMASDVIVQKKGDQIRLVDLEAENSWQTVCTVPKDLCSEENVGAVIYAVQKPGEKMPLGKPSIRYESNGFLRLIPVRSTQESLIYDPVSMTFSLGGSVERRGEALSFIKALPFILVLAVSLGLSFIKKRWAEIFAVLVPLVAVWTLYIVHVPNDGTFAFVILAWIVGIGLAFGGPLLTLLTRLGNVLDDAKVNIKGELHQYARKFLSVASLLCFTAALTTFIIQAYF